MKYAHYNKIIFYEDFEVYDFTSVGAKGNIPKRVRFDFVAEPILTILLLEI